MSVTPKSMSSKAADLFGNSGGQGDNLAAEPISPSNWYYAFLSKVDQDWKTKRYELLFEVVSKEWMENAVLKDDEAENKPAPSGPAMLFHLRDVEEADILDKLQLANADELADGTWHLLELEPDWSELPGDLYEDD